MIGIEFMMLCAPQVAPQTIQAIIQVESGGNPLAIGINGPVKLAHKPQDARDAAHMAKVIIQAGYSVDLGLMQINSRNLPSLGYTVEQMFDPCTNIEAGARILARGYAGAVKQWGSGQGALRAALSAYNTGNYTDGFKNGYVAKYYRSQHHPAKLKTNTVPAKSSSALLPHPIDPHPYGVETTVYLRKDREHEP